MRAGTAQKPHCRVKEMAFYRFYEERLEFALDVTVLRNGANRTN